MNKNYLKNQGELLLNPQEMNDGELAHEAAQHSYGTKCLNRQLAGGGVFANAPDFKITIIAAVCAAMAGVCSMPAQASQSVPVGEYLDLSVASDDNDSWVELTQKDFPLVSGKDKLFERVIEDTNGTTNVRITVTENGNYITKSQNYSGRTEIFSDGSNNSEVRVKDGVNLFNSSAIFVDQTAQIYFEGNSTIQALEGKGRVGMTSGKVLTVDYGSSNKNITIQNQFLAQSIVVFKRKSDGDDNPLLGFDIVFTGNQWNNPVNENWGFASMSFENFDVSMDDPGTKWYLGDEPIVTGQHPAKNVHMESGSHMLFSLGGEHKQYKLYGGLYLNNGGTLNYKGLALDHDRFGKDADDSILTVGNFIPQTKGTKIEISFSEAAASNFNIWNNQEVGYNYLVRSNKNVNKNDIHLNINGDGRYTQTINQAESPEDGNDATLHWIVEEAGWESLKDGKVGEVLKYSSMLDEIHLEEQDKYPDSSFVVDAKGVVDPQDGSRDLKVKLTGEGNVKFVSGTVTLTSAGNTYSGKTIVATNSKLVIGSGSSLGQTRELNINKEGTVDASQEIVKVPGHTVNSGTLIIGEKTFTTETYDGKKGSTIQVNTLLKGNNGSTTGKLVVNGTATGSGFVDVIVLDGSEARALDRLDVVTMAPGSTLALELTDKEGIQYGEYTYMLVRTDKNSDSKRAAWYLTTTKKPQKTPDNPSKNPDPDPDDSENPDNASGQTPVEDEKNPATPDNQGGTGGGSGGSDVVWTTSTLKTPQAGARAGLAYLAAEVFDLSLRGHVGDRVYYDLLTGEERETSLWMLNMGNWSRFGDTTSQLGFDGRTNVTHLGGDLYKWNLNDTDTLRIGLLGSYGEADYNTKSDVTWLEADANFEGWSVGAYASWQTRAESGPFANGQIRWNRFENEVQEEGLEKDKYDSEGLSATFEAGWTQRLFTKKNSGGYNIAFDLEPRAHFYWMDFDAETGFDSTGQRFDTDGKSNLMTSLGVRASLKLTDDVMPQWNDPAMHFFVEGNWVHYSRDFNATVMNEKGSSTATVDLEDFAEARLGAVMHLSDDFLVWGDFNLRSGEDDYESYGYNVGAKYLY